MVFPKCIWETIQANPAAGKAWMMMFVFFCWLVEWLFGWLFGLMVGCLVWWLVCWFESPTADWHKGEHVPSIEDGWLRGYKPSALSRSLSLQIGRKALLCKLSLKLLYASSFPWMLIDLYIFVFESSPIFCPPFNIHHWVAIFDPPSKFFPEGDLTLWCKRATMKSDESFQSTH